MHAHARIHERNIKLSYQYRKCSYHIWSIYKVHTKRLTITLHLSRISHNKTNNHLCWYINNYLLYQKTQKQHYTLGVLTSVPLKPIL